MRICPHCAAPMGASGCVICGPPLRAEDGVNAPWHVSSSLKIPPPFIRKAPEQSLSQRMNDAGLKFPELAPNCYECRFFNITHEPVFPRACTKLGFKGKELPSHTLFNVTGKNCPWLETYVPPVA